MLPIVDSSRSSAPRLSTSTSRWSSRGRSSSASTAMRIAATGVRSWWATCDENARSRSSSSRMRSSALGERAAEGVELVDARVRRRHAFGLADRLRPVAEVLDRAAQAAGEQDSGEHGRRDDRDGGESEHPEVALHPVMALGRRLGDAHDELGAVVAGADRERRDEVAVDDPLVHHPVDAPRRRSGRQSVDRCPRRAGPMLSYSARSCSLSRDSVGEVDRSGRRHPPGDDRRLALQRQQLAALDVATHAGGGRHEEREHRQRGDGDDRRQDPPPHAGRGRRRAPMPSRR